MNPIYLDYAATTPVAPEVATAMADCLTLDGVFANPASRSHRYGWEAEEAVEAARGQVAALIGADAREIVWTSGATESNNLALKGVCEPGDHLLVSSYEHKAVLDVAEYLGQQGVNLGYLAPGKNGIVDAQVVESALQDNTRLVSVMWVNNELGTINPIAEIAELCNSRGVLLHVDAAQALGKLPVNMAEVPVDLLSVSAHKCYGPKGIGALYVRRRPGLQVKPQVHGGGHERGMRSGTLATHQCVGFGVAANLAAEKMAADVLHMAQLRNRLWQGLQSLPAVQCNGDQQRRVASHLNVAFGDLDGETLLLALRKVAVSSGSACTSASMSPSHVLQAIGLSQKAALSSIRFSVGRYTTVDDIEHAITHIQDVVKGLSRQAS